MNRRLALVWISRVLAAGVAAVVAVPGVQYVLASVRRRKGSGPLTQPVARLADLKPNLPFLAAFVAKHQDAWTVYPEQTVGRAWLVRRTDDKIPPEQAKVDAYCTVCPHLGCAIGLAPDKTGFQCPCHSAVFDLEGGVKSGPAPRPMDALEAAVVSRDGDWWVEVKYEQFAQGSAAKISTS